MFNLKDRFDKFVKDGQVWQQSQKETEKYKEHLLIRLLKACFVLFVLFPLYVMLLTRYTIAGILLFPIIWMGIKEYQQYQREQYLKMLEKMERDRENLRNTQ